MKQKQITIKRDGQNTWEVRMGDGGIFLHDLDKFINDALCIFIENEKEKIAEDVAILFSRSPLNMKKDKDVDKFYLDVLHIIKNKE
jgi:hypothetical protein